MFNENGSLNAIYVTSIEYHDAPTSDDDQDFPGESQDPDDNGPGGNCPAPTDPKQFPPGTNRLTEYHKDQEAFRNN